MSPAAKRTRGRLPREGDAPAAGQRPIGGVRVMAVVVGRILVALLAWWIAPLAHAHKPSDSYLTIEVKGAAVDGRWDIALRDLDFALQLDADGNGELTWGEVRARHADIAAYAAPRLQ